MSRRVVVEQTNETTVSLLFIDQRMPVPVTVNMGDLRSFIAQAEGAGANDGTRIIFDSDGAIGVVIKHAPAS